MVRNLLESAVLESSVRSAPAMTMSNYSSLESVRREPDGLTRRKSGYRLELEGKHDF